MKKLIASAVAVMAVVTTGVLLGVAPGLAQAGPEAPAPRRVETRARGNPARQPSAAEPAAPASRVSPSARDARVILYGDSLAWESEEFFVDALTTRGVESVTTRTMGGTAICDWLDEMVDDALSLRPTSVVVEFSGNALTPCMTGPDSRSLSESREAYEQKYRSDALEVLRIFSDVGTRVHFVGAPISRVAAERGDPKAGWFNALYESLATILAETEYVDAGAAVLRNGRWTEVLPCLPTEPCTGGLDTDGVAVNVVRAPDGGHFCPGAPAAVRGVTAGCSVWSSGAFRYGKAMADGVAMD